MQTGQAFSGEGSKKSTRSIACKVVGVVAAIVLVISVLLAVVLACQISTQVGQLQADVAQIAVTQADPDPSQEQQTIQFLQSEMQRHREFIESQEQHLIWLVATIGALAIFMLSMAGLANRKEIQETVREEGRDFAREEWEDLLGGPDKESYLRSVIQNEECIKNKKILFLFRQGDEEGRTGMKGVCDALEDKGFPVERQTMPLDENMDFDFDRIVDENDLIIYQVGADEAGIEQERVSQARYYALYKACKRRGKIGILYYQGVIKAFPGLDKDYLSCANMGLTLKQQIIAALYL